MIARTPAEVLGHYAALHAPTDGPEKPVAKLEKKIREIAENYALPEAPETLNHSIQALRAGLRNVPDSSPIDPTILLEDIVNTLVQNNIPIRQFGL